jgi:hypothetical protein
MAEHFNLQLGDGDAPLLNLVTKDTILLSSEIGHNGVRYVILATMRRADIERWCEALDQANRPYRLERVSESGESEEVRVHGSPDWLS